MRNLQNSYVIRISDALLADKLVPPAPPPFLFSILLLRLRSPSLSLSGSLVCALPLSDCRKAISFWLQLLLVRALESKFSPGWKRGNFHTAVIPQSIQIAVWKEHTHRRSHVVESVVNLSNRTEPECRNNFREKRSSKSFTIFTFFLFCSFAEWVSDLGRLSCLLKITSCLRCLCGVCARFPS